MRKYRNAILLLAAAAIVSAALHVCLTARYSDWVSTDGVVTDIVFHKSVRRRTKDSYEIHFSYNADGVSYQGVSVYSGSKTEQMVGKTVTVWYDPDDPGASSFHKPGPGLWPLVPFIFGLRPVLKVLLPDRKKTGRNRPQWHR